MEYTTTIKAIEQTIQEQCLGDCNQCKYTRVFAGEKCPFRALEYALGIIYRQNAEVEHLKCEELLLRKKARLNIFDRIAIEREAIKKFVELLKENANNWNELTVEQIERLAKIKRNGG